MRLDGTTNMTGNLIVGTATSAMSLTLSDIVGAAWLLATGNTNYNQMKKKQEQLNYNQ